MGLVAAKLVEAVAQLAEELHHQGVPHGAALRVGQQVLLRDVRDVGRLLVLSQQVVVGLVLRWAHGMGDREPPLLGVAEGGVDVEHHPAERVQAVPHDLTDLEPSVAMDHGHATGNHGTAPGLGKPARPRSDVAEQKRTWSHVAEIDQPQAAAQAVLRFLS